MNSTIVTSLITVDTNILIYSVDASETLKHSIATRIVRVLGANRAPLPVQCLSEFYFAVTRKQILTPEAAEEVVRGYLGFFLSVSAFPADVVSAIAIHQQHRLQFFDCVLLAVTKRAGCTVFLSEGMKHNQVIDGITILNPFLLTPSELDALLS